MKNIIYLISFFALFGCGDNAVLKSPKNTSFSEFKSICKGAYTSAAVCNVKTSGMSNILDWNKVLNCSQSKFKTLGWIKYSELSIKDQQLVSHFYQWDDNENSDCKTGFDLYTVLIGGCYTEVLAPDGSLIVVYDLIV